MTYNFHYKINLRCPRYLVTSITSSTPLGLGTLVALRNLLLFDLHAEIGYPLGIIEAITKQKYNKALGWEERD